MNAAPRLDLPQQRRSRRPAAISRVTRLPSAAGGARSHTAHSSPVSDMPSRTAGQKVEKLSVSQRPKPIWLVSLLFLQRSSDLIAFLLVAGTLTIYSWTVYTQQQWSREYRKLETLQRTERQLTTANAVMKNQLAQQAEKPGTGLVTPTQANTIFLPSAPQRPSHTAPTQSADPEPAQTSPLGY
jgi:hypothetical protein